MTVHRITSGKQPPVALSATESGDAYLLVDGAVPSVFRLRAGVAQAIDFVPPWPVPAEKPGAQLAVTPKGELWIAFGGVAWTSEEAGYQWKSADLPAGITVDQVASSSSGVWLAGKKSDGRGVVLRFGPTAKPLVWD